MTDQPSTQQTEGQQPTVERGGLWGLFFSTAGLLLPPYGAILSVFGIIQGIRARRSAKANGAQAPGAMLSIIVGIVGIAFSALFAVQTAVLWDENTALRECTAKANTVSSQDQCDATYKKALEERFSDYPQIAELL
ncbi:DUF4190 domain-containing protein [Nocardiopsis ansamitocini]|uniref:DUF4190 domain-containing protein n=1 Tax=Nocardiopsis ansamitocini TaxID=1670832 RepID=A0A9W6P8J5_9ACTN|nr:DUF4190 domain-containing protein [Nocardiopsis ansamitocini]GLU49555.1 hypothetical protein Nans01_39060 [Nocardiopsis ansamitocini]